MTRHDYRNNSDAQAQVDALGPAPRLIHRRYVESSSCIEIISSARR